MQPPPDKRKWRRSPAGKKLAGENVLRVLREAEAVSRRLQKERPPSTATIEALDGPAVVAPAEAKR